MTSPDNREISASTRDKYTISRAEEALNIPDQNWHEKTITTNYVCFKMCIELIDRLSLETVISFKTIKEHY